MARVRKRKPIFEASYSDTHSSHSQALSGGSDGKFILHVQGTKLDLKHFSEMPKPTFL